MIAKRIPTFRYDIDGNLVDYIDFDHAELLSEEILDGGWLGNPTAAQSIVKNPEGGYQIGQIDAKVKLSEAVTQRG